MYVDESGDCGLVNSPTRYFVLTGLVIHETVWRTSLDRLISFRRRIHKGFGLMPRTEIHTYAFLNRPGNLAFIKRNDRLTIIRLFADELASMSDISLVCVVVDKLGKPEYYDVFESAWKILLQRFENTMFHGNFPGAAHPNEHGMIFPDYTDEKKLLQLLRKMRRFNLVPGSTEQGTGSRNLILQRVVEDPNFRNSEDSYFVQSVDLTAYLLQQHLAPSKFMKKKSAQNYFDRLDPILCKVSSRSDPRGIVRL
jgi:Protein of unknown function (DUF3800)